MELLARFIDQWEMPRSDLPASKRVAVLMEATKTFCWHDLVTALNALFGEGGQMRPSTSQVYNACARAKYRRMRRAGVAMQLTEGEYVEHRVAQLASRVQNALASGDRPARVGEGNAPPG